MKTNHLLNIFLITFLLFAPLWASEPTQPDAVYHEVLHEYTLQPDGSTVYHHSHSQKMLSYLAFTRKYGESFIIYDPQFQELKINRSVTVMADGQEVESPFNAYNEVLPRFAEDAPAYNRLREMVVTHPGMELGATVHLDYQISSKPGFLPAFMEEVVLTRDCPIEKLTVRVTVPAGTHLQHELLNMSGEPEISQSEETSVYQWTFRNLPAVLPGKNQPAAERFQPTLRFSAAKEWEPVYRKFCEKAAFQMESTPDLAALVEILKKENVSKMELLCALQEKVVRELALFPVPLPTVGYRCRPAAEIWRSNGGTPLEKALLLSVLLREAGFESAAPLLLASAPLSKGVPVLQSFDRVAVGIKAEQGDWLILPVDRPAEQNLRLSTPIFAAWRLGADGGEQLSLQAAPTAMATLSGKWQLDTENQLSGKLELTLQGAANPYLQHIRHSDTYEKLLGRVLKPARVENPELLRLTEGEAVVSGEISGKANLRSRKEYLFWEIPAAPRGISDWHLPPMPLSRTTPLQLPAALQQSEQLTVELPENLQLVGKGRNIRGENEAGHFYLKVSTEGNVVYIQREIHLKGEIAPEIYPDFQRLWSLWSDPANQRVVLKHKKTAN